MTDDNRVRRQGGDDDSANSFRIGIHSAAILYIPKCVVAGPILWVDIRVSSTHSVLTYPASFEDTFTIWLMVGRIKDHKQSMVHAN
jgi:hypothetical protein